MTGRFVLLGLGVAGLLAATSSTATAQVVDDFLCSSFSYKCNQSKPLPPPSLAPAEAPAPAKAKHAGHPRKVKRTPAPKAEPAPAAAANQAPQ